METKSRIIKFRGMDANGIMRYGRLSQDKPNSTVYYKEYSQRICWDDSNIPVKNSTLGQYAGLQDKNGKEIYEGDCLGDWEDEQWVCYGIVTYDDYNGRYFLADKKGYATDYETYENSDWNQLEVINNVYENPELLK